MILEFKIKNQQLIPIENKNFIVEKSQEYLKVKFNFETDDWKDTYKLAIFSHSNTSKNISVELDENNECFVPSELILNGSLIISLLGVKDTYRVTTNVSVLQIRKTGEIFSEKDLKENDNYSIITSSFNNFDLDLDEKNNLHLRLKRQNGDIEEKVILLKDNDDYIDSGYYDTEKQAFIFNYISSRKIEVNFKIDLSNYYNSEQIDVKFNELKEEVKTASTSINETKEELQENINNLESKHNADVTDLKTEISIRATQEDINDLVEKNRILNQELQALRGAYLKGVNSVDSFISRTTAEGVEVVEDFIKLNSISGNSEISPNLINNTTIKHVLFNSPTSYKDKNLIDENTVSFTTLDDNTSSFRGFYYNFTEDFDNAYNGKILTLSFEVISSIGGTISYAGTSTTLSAKVKTKLTRTFTYDKGKSLTIYVGGQNNEVSVTNIQLEVGNTATTYVKPYKGIKHANIGELVSTGKNLLKDIVTNSTINDKGAILSSQASNTSDYVKVFSNTQYTISGVSLGDTNYRYIGFYDENKKFISNVGLYNTNKVTFTTPTNAMYVIICFKNNAANIQLELGSSATSYTPYIEPTKLSLNLDLPKGYKLTEDGLVKSWGSVDLSTLSWGYEASYPRFIANLSSLKPKLPTNNDTKANMLCSKYTTETLADVIDRSHKVGIALSTGGFISINEPAYTDISTFVNTIQGVILEYELATPITDESIKLPSSNLIAYKGGMEYFTNTEIPVTLDADYNIKA